MGSEKALPWDTYKYVWKSSQPKNNFQRNTKSDLSSNQPNLKFQRNNDHTLYSHSFACLIVFTLTPSHQSKYLGPQPTSSGRGWPTVWPQKLADGLTLQVKKVKFCLTVWPQKSTKSNFGQRFDPQSQESQNLADGLTSKIQKVWVNIPYYINIG